MSFIKKTVLLFLMSSLSTFFCFTAISVLSKIEDHEPFYFIDNIFLSLLANILGFIGTALYLKFKKENVFEYVFGNGGKSTTNDIGSFILLGFFVTPLYIMKVFFMAVFCVLFSPILLIGFLIEKIRFTKTKK